MIISNIKINLINILKFENAYFVLNFIYQYHLFV